MADFKSRYKTQHALSLLASVGQLKEEESLCDFTIKVGSKSFDVHGTIISACSRYFHAMLTHDMKESRESTVDMKDVTAESVEKCIEFMYHGEVDLKIDDVENVLHTASIMQLDLLVEVCFEYFKRNISVENVFLIKDLAKVFHNVNISEFCIAYIVEHFEEVSKQEEFLALDYAELLEYVRNLGVDKGLMWQAIVQWMGGEKERKVLLSEILENYYATHTDMYFLLTVVLRTRSVRKSPPCMEYIQNILLSDFQRANESVTVETCYNIKYILKKCRMPDADILTDKVNSFMVDNFEQISQMLEWVNLDEDDVVKILQDDKLSCSSETTKWDAMLKWAKHVRRRKENFHELLKLLKFDVFTDEFIEIIRKEPLVAESAACMGIVLEAVIKKAGRRLQTEATASGTSYGLQNDDEKLEASDENPNSARGSMPQPLRFDLLQIGDELGIPALCDEPEGETLTEVWNRLGHPGDFLCDTHPVELRPPRPGARLQISDDSDDDSWEEKLLAVTGNWQSRRPTPHFPHRHPPHHPPPYGHRHPPPHHPPPFGHHRHPPPHHHPPFRHRHPPPHHHPRWGRGWIRHHHHARRQFGPRGHQPWEDEIETDVTDF